MHGMQKFRTGGGGRGIFGLISVETFGDHSTRSTYGNHSMLWQHLYTVCQEVVTHFIL